MKTVILLITILFSLSYGIEYQLMDYRLGGSCGPVTPKACTTGGNLCESCTSLVACTKPSQTSDWIKIPLDTCSSPNKCVNGQCTNASDPVCDGVACLDFSCQQTGVFPDPFFWTKYVICVKSDGNNLKPFVQECDEGFTFNIKTGYCDIPVNNIGKNTPYPIDLCTKAGQSVGLRNNPAYYYICKIYSNSKKVLYPVLYHCPGKSTYSNYVCK